MTDWRIFPTTNIFQIGKIPFHFIDTKHGRISEISLQNITKDIALHSVITHSPNHPACL